VSVTADGGVYLDTTAVTLTELETRLARLRALDPDVPIVVKGDASVRYDSVVQVLDVLKTVKITNVGLVTQRLVR